MTHIEKNKGLIPVNKWQKAEKTENKRNNQKEKIRAAFAHTSEVEIIPAKVFKPDGVSKPLRVAAYCRVSTYEETQAGSFELQLQHYQEMIKENSNWILADIYADEGVSGTSTKGRFEFLRMIEDCKTGKIDFIITKSVSRFARNIRDCLEYVRVLKLLSPPVGILFETENLNTLENKNEFTLGVMSLVAQGESEQKSAAIIWSIIERFKKGIPIISTHNLLGYDKDSFGRLVIIEEEEAVVRHIYTCYIRGMSLGEIAASLNNAHIPTVQGKTCWRNKGILSILKNEKYCGDVLMQKTFTADCFSHKKIINNGQKTQYRLRDHHPAIIPRAQWILVQEQLKIPRPSKTLIQQPQSPKILISKLKSGPLKGFILIDPNWKSIEMEDIFKIVGFKL